MPFVGHGAIFDERSGLYRTDGGPDDVVHGRLVSLELKTGGFLRCLVTEGRRAKKIKTEGSR